MTQLSSFNPADEVLVDKRFSVEEQAFDGSGSISLSAYKPNHLTYDVNSSEEAFAVFSEVYYATGWNAYVDGELNDHYRVNYVLRGMPLPKGKYQVEFKFEPTSVAIGSSIALVCSILIYLLIGFVGFKTFRKS
jgi:uncharacterized membrane protein YfhO